MKREQEVIGRSGDLHDTRQPGMTALMPLRLQLDSAIVPRVAHYYSLQQHPTEVCSSIWLPWLLCPVVGRGL